MRRRPLLLLPALLAACEALPPAESARLPPGSVDGAGDPTRAAVSRAVPVDSGYAVSVDSSYCCGCSVISSS